VAKKKLRPIHRNIAALREALGLSQSALAAKLRVDETAVSHWEHGRSAPRGSRLERVASALGVTVPDLFRDAEESA
jgi:transcriptional regulator with XRE-family HTH domain